MPGDRSTSLKCLLLAALVMSCALLWQALTVRYHYAGNWTALSYTGDRFPPPPSLRQGTYLFKDSFGYDGQFYRYLAHDPFLQRGYASYMDNARLRSRRILVPLLAWLLALGDDARIDPMMRLVVLLSLFAGVWWCAQWLVHRGRSPAWALLFVLTPAAISSVDRMLVDATLLALFTGFLYFSETGRWWPAYFAAMAAMLTRETGLLLVIALALFWILKKEFLRAAVFSTAALPALAWYAFIHLQLPASPGPSFSWPLVGFVHRLFWRRQHPDHLLSLLMQAFDLAALAGFAASLVLAVVFVRRAKIGPGEIAVLLFAALAITISSPDWMVEAYSYGRPTSPLLLFVALEAVASGWRWALAPPLAVAASTATLSVNPLISVLKGLMGRGLS